MWQLSEDVFKACVELSTVTFAEGQLMMVHLETFESISDSDKYPGYLKHSSRIQTSL